MRDDLAKQLTNIHNIIGIYFINILLEFKR